MNDYFVETSIKKIREASENNKLVVFVGAGVSANSGMPTWKDLIMEMAKDLGEFNVENQDLYLKIPQYYYNERGEKEYFEKLNEVFFKKKYKPNPIHKEIFKLKPTHIITTNYDTLLEESAIEEGQFYHTVSDDLDLPYDNLNKTIIKMHGDFVNRNIVLKEDDYLNYSSNFTLIESYIKSLIATNTVLFIGYSVNDSNFNLIFQWVKNILNNHFQPAYLIESSKEYSRMEHAYYKNRGINILYYDEMHELQENNVFNSSNWRGNRLFDVVNYFNTFDKMKKMNELEYIYDRLSCFEKLNFIMPDQVVKSLKLKSVGYDMFGDKTLTILGEENQLSKIFSNSEQYKGDFIFDKILMIFDKANIKGVSKEKKIIYSKDKDNDDYLDTIITNIIEYDSLFETIDINNFTSLIEGEDYFLMLKQAYAYYENESFFDAYKYYKTISLKAFQDKEYLIYYISEFNRKHVGHFLIHSPFSKLDSNLEAEIEELNLEDIYFKLPYKERKGLEFLNEIQNFNLIYKVQNKLRKEVNELNKTKRTVENGGFSVNSSLSKNFHIINNIWLFMKANYLCIDKYTEVQSLYISFIEGVFASYSTKTESNSKGFFSDIKVNKIEELNLFEIYIIITKLKKKDLENVLEEYNLKEINIEEQVFEYIMKILDKTTINIFQDTTKEKSERYLYNLLTLISRVNLNTQQVNEIAEKLLLLINERTYLKECKYINKFIVSAANREVISQETVLKYLEKYLKVYQHNRRIIEFDNSGLYRNLTKIYKSYSEYPINETIISGYLGLVKQYYEEKDYNSLYEVLGELVLPINESLNDKHKNSILNVVQKLIEEMENKKDSLNLDDIFFYYKSSIIGVITANKEINKKILEDTVSKINNQKKGVRVYPDPVERNLGILTDLYREGYIQKQEIQDYVSQFNGYSEYFDLVFNNKELELTDIELLSYLTETETENIMKNDLIKEKAYSLLEKKFIEPHSIKLKNIFEKLYLKKF